MKKLVHLIDTKPLSGHATSNGAWTTKDIYSLFEIHQSRTFRTITLSGRTYTVSNAQLNCLRSVSLTSSSRRYGLRDAFIILRSKYTCDEITILSFTSSAQRMGSS